MRVDVDQSSHRESATARKDFDKDELKKLRVLLRRLRFLEAQVRANGGLQSIGGSGGAAFAEWEHDALEFVLTEIGFLAERGGES